MMGVYKEYMEEPQTWRNLLGAIVEDAHERQRIARIIGVNPITLVRWATGVSSPRQRILSTLLDVLSSEQRDKLTPLLTLDYPTLLSKDQAAEEEGLVIPAAFYARALETYTNNSIFLRTAAISIIILQQMLTQLDPHHEGLAIFIVQCMPPSAGSVRSVRITQAQGSGPWRRIEHHIQFCGIESQIGHAVQEERLIVTHSRKERENWYPAHLYTERSAVTAPIRLANRVAGGIGLLNAQENYFSEEKINLILSYTELLVLAFEQYEFYPANQVELGVIPSFKLQQPYIDQFQPRVRDHMVQALHEKQFLPRLQAEKVVWQKLENHILHLS